MLTTEISATKNARLNAWLQESSLTDLVDQITSQVRTHPMDAEKRWLLCQLFCLRGEWERALKQLQTSVQLQPEREQNAQVIRGLIRGEVLRADVLQGKAQPGFVLDPPPEWTQGLLEALRLAANGQTESADEAREQALSRVPDTGGKINDETGFTWISDSDTRLGPICELMIAGLYRWCPFCEIASLSLFPPEGMLDLLWARAEIVLVDGTALKAYIPARYPDSEHGSDAECLARITTWRETGRTGVIGLGQKTWMTDVGDQGLLDIRRLQFSAPAA